ncbi:MAG TPA: NAD(+) diphosphatase [Xanthobacteraceae bacterium]|nr:NAD(+) diphosphatase [Xanthobacteraceae bacterium]
MSPRPDLGPKPQLGYTASLLDRAAHRRADAVGLAAHPGASAYVVGGELVVTRKHGNGGDPLFGLAAARALAPAHESVLLGLCDETPRFGFGIGVQAAEALKARDDLLVTDLRSIAVQGLVASEHLPPLAEAKAMLAWHARHRFCANCGAPTEVIEAGWKRECAACKAEHFPRTDPVVIMLAVRGDRCLLGRSARFASAMWSCLAGFIEPGESIEEAVRREVREEAGIACGHVHYLASQPWPFPMSLMIGCHAEALTTEIKVDAELEGARWFEREEVALMLLRRHPDGLGTPPPVAIAHHIIRAWVEGEALGCG